MAPANLKPAVAIHSYFNAYHETFVHDTATNPTSSYKPRNAFRYIVMGTLVGTTTRPIEITPQPSDPRFVAQVAQIVIQNSWHVVVCRYRKPDQN